MSRHERYNLIIFLAFCVIFASGCVFLVEELVKERGVVVGEEIAPLEEPEVEKIVISEEPSIAVLPSVERVENSDIIWISDPVAFEMQGLGADDHVANYKVGEITRGKFSGYDIFTHQVSSLETHVRIYIKRGSDIYMDANIENRPLDAGSNTFSE